MRDAYSWTSRLWRGLLLGVLIHGAALVGYGLSPSELPISLVWLPTGIAVAAIYRLGFWVVPVLAIAGLVSQSYAFQLPPHLVLLMLMGQVGAPCLVVGTLRWLRFDPNFAHRAEIGKFLTAAGLGMSASASLGVLALWLGDALSGVTPTAVWWTWWLGDTMGVVIVAPLGLALRREAVAWLPQRWAEFLSWLLAVSGMATLMAVARPGSLAAAVPLIFLPLPLVLWASFRFGRLGGSFAVLVLSIVLGLLSVMGLGPFLVVPGSDGVPALWAELATLALLSVMVTAFQGERNVAEASLAQSRAMLETIQAAQSRFIAGAEVGDSLRPLLESMQASTNSPIGFIGEVTREGPGELLLRVAARSDLPWHGPVPKVLLEGGPLVFGQGATIFGEVMRTGRVCSTDDMATDARWKQPPAGHATLHAVLAIPVYHSGGLVGVVALANRRGGYSATTVETLAPLTATSARLLAAAQQHRAQQEAERALRQSTAVLRSRDLALRAISQGVVITSNKGLVTYMNDAAVANSGISLEAALGKPAWMLSANAHIEERQPEALVALRSGKPWQGEIRAILGDGSAKWGELSITPVPDETGAVAQFVSVLRDITERKRDEEALRRTARILQETGRIAQVGGWEYDIESQEVNWSEEICRILEVPQGTAVSLDAALAYYPGAAREEVRAAMQTAEAEGGSWDLELPIVSATGTEKFVRIHGVAERKDGRVARIFGILQDITERHRQARQIRELAYFDPLTELPNRRLLRERLVAYLEDAQHAQQYAALLFVDLDHFKVLNDTMGHQVGDELLVQLAARLAQTLRGGDTLARLGGDEFVVLLVTRTTDAEEARDIAWSQAERLRRAVSLPFRLRDTEYQTTASIGVALALADSGSADELLRHADAAMYQAKAAGRNEVRFFDPGMQAAMEEAAQLESDLQHAAVRGQLELYLQPQVDMSERLIGAEVLLRWHHPNFGLVGPGVFMPLAERSGRIVEIGLWVMRSACQLLVDWQAEPQLAAVPLSVNVSARQLRHPRFVEDVEELLAALGVPPGLLQLELTESTAFDQPEEVRQKMLALQAHKVTFAMDDFGTGWSSLAAIRALPLQQLKIDQSFVRHVDAGGNDAVIVRSVIAMAHTLGLSVLAEGVETAAQFAFLREAGCDAVQGYLYGRPQPVDAFLASLGITADVTADGAPRPGTHEA